MYVHTLAFVAVAVGAVVFPDHLLVQGDFLKSCPCVMKKDVAVGQQVNVMVTGVTTLRSGRLMGPEDIALGIGDGDYVLAVGGADEDKTLRLDAEEGEAQEDGGKKEM